MKKLLFAVVFTLVSVAAVIAEAPKDPSATKPSANAKPSSPKNNTTPVVPLDVKSHAE